MIKRHMRCAINPAVGDERFIHVAPADTKLNIAVVGGGPAGLEAARIGTMRGHQVTVFEKTEEVGGAILYCCTVRGKNKMRWYADWLRQQVAKLGVEIKYKTVPKAADLKGYDLVLVACGSEVARADIKGIDSARVCTYEDVLRCKAKNCEYWPKGGREAPVEVGDTVLVWGDHYGAVDAVEKMAGEGRQVTVVTPNKEFASWLEPCTRDVMVKRLAGGNGEGLTGKTFAHPVTVIPNSTVLEIGEDGEVVILSNSFERSRVKVDNVVLATVQANDSLYKEYLDAGLVASKIGDARKVRNLRGAVTDGANAGLTADKDLQLNANRAVVASLPTDVAL